MSCVLKLGGNFKHLDLSKRRGQEEAEADLKQVKVLALDSCPFPSLTQMQHTSASCFSTSRALFTCVHSNRGSCLNSAKPEQSPCHCNTGFAEKSPLLRAQHAIPRSPEARRGLRYTWLFHTSHRSLPWRNQCVPSYIKGN